jgi:hypothetical protein
MKHKEKLKKALDLLERAVADEIRAPDPQWFRDYFLLTGQHMILTDEGWEDGSSKPAYTVKTLPAGCGYQGYEFGASYPDSICCGGRLYDADRCDNEGNLYEPTDDIPCPMCHPILAARYWGDFYGDTKAGKALIADIRRNRGRNSADVGVKR